MKKALIVLVFVSVSLFSCKDKELSTEEGILKIEKTLQENFDKDFEVYQLSLNASTLESNLDNISRVYKVKDIFFNDKFEYNGFTDPIKSPGVNLLKRKNPFKVGQVDVSIIPAKYDEALGLLKEKGLFKEDVDYLLNNWVFEADKNGDVFSEFDVQYETGSSSSGKVITIIYEEYRFRVNKDNTLIFIK
ncbi:hypothetical protein [Cellulophaga fucicola]|uniref:Lipoprotein n=1 Tax=Cellulophaga fucicola TaxID=76595 RepID=A0A1K1NXH6_9FLAO|nr:hypothetical protein [Cellulophaga fucicola]SFW40015.1 hypothetical protein SAMN05660313_01441 [Cellulophaga fucicola]